LDRLPLTSRLPARARSHPWASRSRPYLASLKIPPLLRGLDRTSGSMPPRATPTPVDAAVALCTEAWTVSTGSLGFAVAEGDQDLLVLAERLASCCATVRSLWRTCPMGLESAYRCQRDSVCRWRLQGSSTGWMLWSWTWGDQPTPRSVEERLECRGSEPVPSPITIGDRALETTGVPWAVAPGSPPYRQPSRDWIVIPSRVRSRGRTGR
jgi:hypothetical protein